MNIWWDKPSRTPTSVMWETGWGFSSMLINENTDVCFTLQCAQSGQLKRFEYGLHKWGVDQWACLYILLRLAIDWACLNQNGSLVNLFTRWWSKAMPCLDDAVESLCLTELLLQLTIHMIYLPRGTYEELIVVGRTFWQRSVLLLLTSRNILGPHQKHLCWFA